MINRSEAERAITTLCLGDTPDTVEAAAVSSAYRSMAFGAHPDHGGTLEAFAAIDRAKHVLLLWIKGRGPEAPSPGMAVNRCGPCDGTGFRKVQHGFKAMRVQCVKCRGTGDLDYEHEKGYDK